MANIHFYAPMSDGAFQDSIDRLGQGGAACTMQSQNFARCSWRGARFIIVHDDDQIRVQLLDDGGLGDHAWDIVEPVMSRGSSQVSGLMVGAPGGDVRVMAAGFFDNVSSRTGLSKNTLLAVGLMTGLTTLLVIRSPKKATETLVIGAAAIAAGIALGAYQSSKQA